MNARKAHAHYKRVNQIMADMDAEYRHRRRPPLWRRLASGLGWRKPLAKWLAAWELKHVRATKIARKKVAHEIAKGA